LEKLLINFLQNRR